MGQPSATVRGLIVASLFMGGVVAAVPVGILTDRLGRVWSLRLGAIFCTIGGVLNAGELLSLYITLLMLPELLFRTQEPGFAVRRSTWQVADLTHSATAANGVGMFIAGRVLIGVGEAFNVCAGEF
jgi:MFS family permease